MHNPAAPVFPLDAPTADELLRTLLDVSLTGVLLVRPVLTAAGGDLCDLACTYANPAAQQLLGITQYPTEALLPHFPAAAAASILACCREAFLSEQTQRTTFEGPLGGRPGYLQLAARRQGALLAVSIGEAPALPGSGTPADLPRLPAATPSARDETEHQHQSVFQVLMLLPANIVLLRGPNHVFELVSPHYQQLFPGRPLLGLAVREALPELAGQGFFEVLDRVYQTGEPVYLPEAETWADFDGAGLQHRYYNASFLPYRDAAGTLTGILNVAFDVTAQVLARQQAAEANQALVAYAAERTQQVQAALHEVHQQREQARVQQGLLSQILGQVPAAVATLSGPTHRYTFFNDAYQSLLGGRATLGGAVAEVIPEVAEQGFVDLLDQVYATGQSFQGTETLLLLHNPATGQPQQRYLDFIYQPLFDGRQQPQGILAFIVDVTERVQARKQADTLQAAMLAVAQRQAQQRQDLYQIFEQAPTAIVLLREPDHRIDYFNPAFQALFPPEEWTGPLQGHTIADVYPRVKLAGLVALLDKVYATGKSQVVLDLPLAELQPGSPRYVTFAYQAYYEQGRIAGVAAFVYDVTEQVLARQQRDARQAELQRIFEQAPVAIAIMRGPALVVELANAAVAAFWGRLPEQVLGRPFFEALPDTAGQGFEQLLGEVLRTGQSVSITEAPVQLDRAHTGQPTQAYVNFVFQPLRDEYQAVTGLIAIGTEVTAQVRARQQVEALNKQLTRTNTDLDTFVYSASHDLKSPITNIEGLLTALREHLPPNAFADSLVPRLLDMMASAVGRFQQTLGHLTDISRLQQEQGQPLEAVDLPALVEAVRLDILPELTAAGATLALDLAGCPAIRFSAKHLRSIVYNLLSNAVKYRAPDRPPLVQLRCYCVPGQVVLEVQDNGLGLSEQQQGQLFRMFRRLHNHVPGSGVGLYMVKRMVENGGGTLTVQSELGVGSTFTVRVPSAA